MEVNELKLKDDRYMTTERFLEINPNDITLMDVRFLLYCWGFKKYFDGKGYTMDKNGNIGCKEYLMNNLKLSDIDNLMVIRLNV